MARKKPRTAQKKRRPSAFDLPSWWLWGALAALALGFAIGWGIRQGLGWNTPAPTPTAAARSNTAYQRLSVETDDDPAWGPEDAPVVIIEFSDYQCPYCGRFHTTTYQRLKEVYGDRIRFVYRDFPLTQIHPEALPAAIAANCAGEQGEYWAFHDKLFQNQANLSADAYLTFAQELGLDMDAFRACLEDPAQKEEVLADQAYAAQLGVTGTPTFFINGIPLVGAQPFEAFQQIIESELNGPN